MTNKDTDKFMERVGIIRIWFEAEEIEVSDQVLGRMASRLGSELAIQKKEIIEWCEKRNEDAQDMLKPEAKPRRTVLNELIDHLKQ